ncbi:MAG: cobalamin B12-binding domain-containing protein [Chloroflexota bacterium]|jgi:trimethylamine corrinoid protein
MKANDQPSDSIATEELVNLRKQFASALRASDRRGARRLLRGLVSKKVDRSLLMREVVGAAVDEVGRGWRELEVSLSQLYAMGLIVEDAMEILSPSRDSGKTAIGKVVIGTARGEYHGLGKRIVVAFLRASGFDVLDLGLSVAPEKLIDTALSKGAQIIAVSALMANTALGIRQVRQEMEKRGAREIKLLVGGAPFRYNEELFRLVGADATAPDAYEAVQVAKALIRESK